MSELPKYVRDLLSEIACGDGLSDYTIELSAGSKHGDNFLGIIHRVVLRGQRNGAPAELRLIIKLSATNEVRRKEFQMDIVFEREALMYNKILPLFEKFQRERGLTDAEAFTSYPKCYAAVADVQNEQFAVIMEDLKVKGFDLLPKERPIDSDHLLLVVGQLARFHAISFAIKDQQPHVYDGLRNVKDLFRNFTNSNGFKQYMDMAFDRTIAVLDNEHHIDWLKDLKEKKHDILFAILADNASDPFAVIGHGDMWLNNMMFHCDSEKVN